MVNRIEIISLVILLNKQLKDIIKLYIDLILNILFCFGDRLKFDVISIKIVKWEAIVNNTLTLYVIIFCPI